MRPFMIARVSRARGIVADAGRRVSAALARAASTERASRPSLRELHADVTASSPSTRGRGCRAPALRTEAHTRSSPADRLATHGTTGSDARVSDPGASGHRTFAEATPAAHEPATSAG
jgi:hypothetical protein